MIGDKGTNGVPSDLQKCSISGMMEPYTFFTVFQNCFGCVDLM